MMSVKYYAGIGSRKTPQEVLNVMTKIATRLEVLGWVLRSGGASGADEAFSKGTSNKVIYLPWKGFNKLGDDETATYIIPTNGFKIAEELHPAWERCSQGVKKLHARNVNQILGEDLNTPVEMVVCWTPDGKEVGGTATAIRLAKSKDIKVINLALPEDLNKILQIIGVTP